MINFYFIVSIFYSLVRIYSSGICDSTKSINKTYGIGNFIYISQEVNEIFKYDLLNNKLSDQKQTYSDIFGTDVFVGVDTAFILDFNPCLANETYCVVVESARDLVLVIGERKADKYGYIAYRLKDNILEAVPNVFNHVWGLTNKGNLIGDIWTNDNKSYVYSGSAFDKIHNILYFIVEQKNENLIIKRLNSYANWKPFIDIKSKTFKGLFNAKGVIFGVDDKDLVYSLQPSNGTIILTPISNAKEFFNCFGNSTLVSKDMTTRYNPFDHSPPVGIQVSDGEEESESDQPDSGGNDGSPGNGNVSDLYPKPGEAEDSSDSNGSDTWFYITLFLWIIGLLILLPMIGFYFYRKNQLKKQSQENEPKAPKAPQAQQSPSPSPSAPQMASATTDGKAKEGPKTSEPLSNNAIKREPTLKTKSSSSVRSE